MSVQKLLEVSTEDTVPWNVVRHKSECLPHLYKSTRAELEADVEGNIYHWFDEGLVGCDLELEIIECRGCAPEPDKRNPDEIPF